MGSARQRPLTVAALLALMALMLALAPVAARSASTLVLITAVFYDTYLDGDPDGAFRITNVGGTEAVGPCPLLEQQRRQGSPLR